MWQTEVSDEQERLERGAGVAVFRRVLAFAAPYRWQLVRAVTAVVATTACAVAGPLIVMIATDRGLLDGERSVLWWCVAAYLGVIALQYVFARQQYLAVNTAGEGFLRDLRIAAFGRLQAQSMSFFDRHPAGVLVARLTADIESLGELVQWGLLQFVAAGLLLVLTLVVMSVTSWHLLAVVAVVLVFVLLASIRFQRQSRAAYLDVRDKVGDNLATLQETIAGVRIIQSYAREQDRRRVFGTSNRALLDSHLHSVRVSVWYFGFVEFVGVFSVAAVVAVGGLLAADGVVTIGAVAAFVLLLANLFEPVQQLSQLYNTVQSAGASLHKVFTLMDAVPDLDESPNPVALPARGGLAVRGVTFAYGGSGKPVLDDVSIEIGAGERLALVGPTGAGKSTLAKVIARLYDPTSGAVEFGGVDLRRARLDELRRRIVVVPQEGHLFSGTLLDNVRLARPSATDAEVEAALEAIGARERFAGLAQGLSTEVRERGSRLSAGERQLVALARAALVDPAVLVLDEATSSLDPGAEAVVERALDVLLADRTVVVVAHRLSTVRRADRIAVVDHGRILELGTYDELVARGGRFAALSAAWITSQNSSGTH